MNERRRLMELWNKGDSSALITLVGVEGSSYRRPGARMLISQSHGAAGSISGGCLEAELIRKSPWRVLQGARVERISTQFDDTSDVPFGLGCGGTLDLLLEPSQTPECLALIEAIAHSLEGNQRTVATWLPRTSAALQRMVTDGEGTVVFASAGLSNAEVAFVCDPAAANGVGHKRGVFVEHLSAPQRLVVLGAGDDARPLVSMAALLGWDVLVMDGRAQLARMERFPEAMRVAVAHTPDAVRAQLRPQDAVVVMTHSYEQDRNMITGALSVTPRYLGLLGARHRSALLLTEAATIAGLPLAECCARVHAPIGLNLGGDGPESIALAILAEAQACCMGRPSGSLHLSPQDVERYLRDGKPASGPASCALEVA